MTTQDANISTDRDDDDYAGPTTRPGSRTFIIETAGYEHGRIGRVGIDLDFVLEDELADYRAGLRGAEARGQDADGYAASEDDRCIWMKIPGGHFRAMAVVRSLPGGDPEIVRFDEPEEGEDHRPRPTTEAELHVWSLIKHIGPEKAREAILARMYPRKADAAPTTLTTGQQHALLMIETIGEKETFDRLFLTGVYELIRDVIHRLGSDACGELRRLIEEGKPIAPRADA